MKERVILNWYKDNEPYDEEFLYGDSDDSKSDVIELTVEQVAEEEENTPVDDLANELIQICLHDLLEKLTILRCINKKDVTLPSFQFPVYKTLEERFGDVIDYGNEIQSEDGKRYMDLTTLYSVFYRTLEEFTGSAHFHSLQEGTKIIQQLYEDENELLQNQENSAAIENNLKEKLTTQAKVMQEKYLNKLEELRQLELEYEDAIGYAKLQFKYIESWEAARRHQGKLVLDRQEMSYRDIVANCDVKTELENKVHEDVVRYCEENTTDMQQEMNYWMEKYEEEVEKRDEQIMKLKLDLEEQVEHYKKLKASYEDRKDFIEYWSNVLTEKKTAEELLQKKIKAALVIQAWWRMILAKKRLLKLRRKARRKAKEINKKR